MEGEMIVLELAFIAIAVYYLYLMVRDYNAMTWDYTASDQDTLWERLLYCGKNSATKLWARFLALTSSIGAIAAAYVPFLNSEEVRNAVTAYMKPQYVAAALVAIAVVTEMARNRTADD
jgi:hypothetical protein